MRKFLLFFFLLTFSVFAQVDLRLSMGINFINTPSLRDYINQNYSRGSELSSFNSAVNFSAESDYYFSGTFAAGVELAYILNSFSYNDELGQKELQYNFLMPSFTAYYVLSGTGYNFKFGGGVGPRFSSVSEKFSIFTTDHTSTGLGFLVKADGNTLLGGDLYANIGAEMRYDLNGSFTVKSGAESEVRLDAFSAGIRLGVTYIF